MVSASMVLPLLILIILSMILLTLFFYRSLEGQVRMHTELVDQNLQSRRMFQILKSETDQQMAMRGAVTETMVHKETGRSYVINAAPMIRIGRTIDDGQPEK